MEYTLFNKYAYLMRNLSVKVTNGVMAPHKAIMLISIIDLIHFNKITSNIIPADAILAETFKKNWNQYVANKKEFAQFKCSIWTPYWHMKNETFWHFCPINNSINVDSLVPAGQTASIGAIRSHIQYAYFDIDLYELLQDANSRETLREILIDTYNIQCKKEEFASVKDSTSICSDKSSAQKTEEITILVDLSYKNQLVEQILKLQGVIGIVQKAAPVIAIFCNTSKFAFDYIFAS